MPFEKGNPGGPGRPTLPSDVKEGRKLNQQELERVLNDLLYLTKEQLDAVKKDSESTMLQLLVASIITHGVNKGDNARLAFLIERLLGKVKDQLHVTTDDLDKMSELELEAEVKRIMAENEAK